MSRSQISSGRKSRLICASLGCHLLASAVGASCPELTERLAEGPFPHQISELESCIASEGDAILEPLKLVLVRSVIEGDANRLWELADLLTRIEDRSRSRSGKARVAVNQRILELLEDAEVRAVLDPGDEQPIRDISDGVALVHRAARSTEEEKFRDIQQRIEAAEERFGAAAVIGSGLARTNRYLLLLCAAFLLSTAVLGRGLLLVHRRQGRLERNLEDLLSQLVSGDEEDAEPEGKGPIDLRPAVKLIPAPAISTSRALWESSSVEEMAEPSSQLEVLEARISHVQKAIEVLEAQRFEEMGRPVTEESKVLAERVPAVYEVDSYESPYHLMITSERKVLEHCWNRFVDRHGEPGGTTNGWPSEWVESGLRDRLLIDLPRQLAADPELAQACEVALAPLREHDQLVSRLALIPSLLSGELPELPDRSKEYWRLRESTALLTSLWNAGGSRVDFDFPAWRHEELQSLEERLAEASHRERVSRGLVIVQEALNLFQR